MSKNKNTERAEFRTWIKSNCHGLSRQELRKLYSAPDMEACKKQILKEEEERRVETDANLARIAKMKPPAVKMTPLQEMFGMIDVLTKDMPYSPVVEHLRDEIKEGLKIVQ